MEGDGMLSQDEINALLNGMDLSAGDDNGSASACLLYTSPSPRDP